MNFIYWATIALFAGKLMSLILFGFQNQQLESSGSLYGYLTKQDPLVLLTFLGVLLSAYLFLLYQIMQKKQEMQVLSPIPAERSNDFSSPTRPVFFPARIAHISTQEGFSHTPPSSPTVFSASTQVKLNFEVAEGKEMGTYLGEEEQIGGEVQTKKERRE